MPLDKSHQDDEDDSGKRVVPDGGVVSVHPMMLDGVQREVAQREAGRLALLREGYQPQSARDAAAAEARYMQRRARLMDARRQAPPLPRQNQQQPQRAQQPPPRTPAATGDAAAMRAAADAARERWIKRTCNSWRGGR
jgi:hypothetical protein